VIHINEPPVDLYAVLTDDRIVEALRLGRTPTNPTPVVALLASWRDACRAGTQHAA
jgi:hypothetical protein